MANQTALSPFGTTGDASFCVTAEGLRAGTLYSMPKQAIIEPGGSVMPHDACRLFFSFQGLLNRDLRKNRIALIVSPETENERFWLDYISRADTVLDELETVTVGSFDAFLKTFEAQLVGCGMVLWDPEVPATANAAATICGLDGFLPVKADPRPDGLQARLRAMGAEVRQSLAGMFTGGGTIPDTGEQSSGSAKCDVYLWAMERYMDRCSAKYMAYLPDGAGCVRTCRTYLEDACAKNPFGANKLPNHDYAIARRAFFFDLTPTDSEPPCDDPGQPPGTDLKTLRRLLLRRYELAGGEWGEVVGFPPWQLKYSSHNDWGSLHATTVEAHFTLLATGYNLYVDADGVMANASVYYHYPLKGSYQNGDKSVTEKFEPDTVYLYYHIGDYDSSPWTFTHLANAFRDAGRGKIPLTWAVNPSLSDRVPMVFDYIYSNLSPADTVCASDSGVGYMRPQNIFHTPDEPHVRELPDGGESCVRYTMKYFDRFGIDAVSFIIGHMSPPVYEMYNKIAPAGSFHYDRAKPITVYRGVPYVPTKNGVGKPGESDEAYLESAKGMYEFLKTTMQGTHFAAFRTICWTPTQLMKLSGTFIRYASEQEPGLAFKFVNAYNFFDLVKQSGEGLAID